MFNIDDDFVSGLFCFLTASQKQLTINDEIEWQVVSFQSIICLFVVIIITHENIPRKARDLIDADCVCWIDCYDKSYLYVQFWCDNFYQGWSFAFQSNQSKS